jgi:hypothetical protein
VLSEGERAELELARAEHVAYFEELEAERFPAWRAWVLETRCRTGEK